MNGPRRWSIRLRRWTWAHRVVAAGFLTLLVLSWTQRQSWLQGSPTGTHLLGSVPFVDPLAALEVLVASHKATLTMFCGAAIPVALTLVFGRFFCGWLCPLGLVLELVGELRDRLCQHLARRNLPVPQWTLNRSFKYWLLAVCLVISAVASVPVFTTLSPINLVVLGIIGFSSIAAIVISVICVLELFVPRAFCRSVCPLGALYSLLGRLAPLRVRVRPGREKLSCARCTMRCPMGIRVMEDYVLAGRDSVSDSECTRCGTCADACRGRILYLSVRAPNAQHGPDVDGRGCAAGELPTE